MRLAVVTDTGPVIHLGELDSLSMLSAIDQLYVPETVLSELEAGGTPDGLSDVSYELVTPDEDAKGKFDALDPGESTALSVAIERDLVLLTDDFEARKTATEAGVEVHGTLGIIALAQNRGLCDRDEAASLMRSLQYETSLFVTDAVIERGIEMLPNSG